VKLAVTNGDTTAYQSFMLTVCNKQTTKILCLGNSITNGTSKYNSYRRDLWKMLHDDNYNFDFIGSWSKHHWGGEMPDADFDMDHDGHSGWTFPQILKAPDWDSSRGNLYQWTKTYAPDIVLIELGTNDVFQCVSVQESMNAFATATKLLRQKNKNVKIFVAQIPPLGKQWAPQMLCHDSISYAQRILNYNDTIARFAKQLTTKASPVIVVDQYTGVNPATDMYDDIHPNDKGELEMAKRWFAAIKQYVGKL
jgi:lysophospholipase L1-like esterase